MNNTSLKALPFAVSVALACTSPAVHALKIGGVVGTDVEHSDNANLDSGANEVSDTIINAFIGTTITEDRGPLTGNFDALLRRQDYIDDTFAEENYLELDTKIRWEQIRNRLVWNVEDYYDQISQNTLAGATPGNLEDTNAFLLSATGTIPVADRHKLLLTPSFRDFYHEKSNNDNVQLGFRAEWEYQLSPRSVLSLVGDYVDIDHDLDLVSPGVSADNERTSYYLGFKTVRSRARLETNIGFTEVERDMGAGTDGVTGFVTYEHNFASRSMVTIHAESEITDTGSNFLNTSGSPTTGSFINVQTANDVVRDNLIRVTYDRRGTALNSTVWVELSDLDYDTAPFDREIQELGARFDYDVTSLLRTNISSNYTITKDQVSLTEDKDFTIRGALDYRWSRQLSTGVGLEYSTKDTDAVPDRGYDDFRVFAGVAYRFGHQ